MAVFAKVVESASFAAAARHFDISPAMVSKHVRALEERSGKAAGIFTVLGRLGL
jgi:DNA-binding transcriptional LysR family regulator